MMNHRLYRFQKHITQIILLVSSYSLLVTMLGCDAFVRKFTRKPKKDNLPREEMVLEPEEYQGSQMTKEELYRSFFIYWKSWHDELIGSLSSGTNHKKQIDCANEAIKNLESIKLLLSEEKGKKLDFYINQLRELKDKITNDFYGQRNAENRLTAERIKRNILRDFSYTKIKDYLA